MYRIWYYIWPVFIPIILISTIIYLIYLALENYTPARNLDKYHKRIDSLIKPHMIKKEYKERS